MSFGKWTCVAVLGGIVVVGCKKEEPPAPQTPPASQTPSTPQVTTTVAPTTPPVGVTNTDVTPPTTLPSGGNLDTGVTGPTTAPSVSTSTQDDPNSALQRIRGMINRGQLDKADAELQKLEANSASYPPAVQSSIHATRSALQAAKSLPMLNGSSGSPTTMPTTAPNVGNLLHGLGQ